MNGLYPAHQRTMIADGCCALPTSDWLIGAPQAVMFACIAQRTHAARPAAEAAAPFHAAAQRRPSSSIQPLFGMKVRSGQELFR